MNKVTMQDIADAAGVSRVTVWKVFNSYESVSEVVRANVLAKARELGYIKGNPEPEQAVQGKNVSVVVASPDSAAFWLNVIHGMARELYLHDINLIYTYMPDAPSRQKVPPVLCNNMVQGAVVLNSYDERLTGGINQLDLPKVFVDVSPQGRARSLNGDVVLLEGYNTVYQITESVLSRGVRKAGFIGDIYSEAANNDRYQGFCQCMRDHALAVAEEFCLTRKGEDISYDREVHAFLDALETLPEAFVCADDQIAHYLLLYFREHRERIPEGIIVAGFDESDSCISPDELITTVSIKTDFFGKRIAMQIIYRMEHNDAPYEMIYVKPPVVCRDPAPQG